MARRRRHAPRPRGQLMPGRALCDAGSAAALAHAPVMTAGR